MNDKQLKDYGQHEVPPGVFRGPCRRCGAEIEACTEDEAETFLCMPCELALENPPRFVCPSCRKPAVVVIYLGWRDCQACGWREQHPADLRGAEG